jgi:hypothetical protein
VTVTAAAMTAIRASQSPVATAARCSLVGLACSTPDARSGGELGAPAPNRAGGRRRGGRGLIGSEQRGLAAVAAWSAASSEGSSSPWRSWVARHRDRAGTLVRGLAKVRIQGL